MKKTFLLIACIVVSLAVVNSFFFRILLMLNNGNP